MRRGGKLFGWFAAVVIAIGLGTYAISLIAALSEPTTIRYGSAILLGAMVVVAELVPLRVPQGDHEGELTVSTTFAFALLLVGGPLPAATSLLLASVSADLIKRKAVWKVSFNAAHYILAIYAADLVIASTRTWYANPGVVSWNEVLGALVAGLVFAVVNTIIMTSVLSIASGNAGVGSAHITVWEVLRGDTAFLTWSYTVLISLGPIVALTAQASLWAVPLFVVPVVAVYQSVSIYLDHERNLLHDVLTGLPNRALFEDRVEQAVAGALRTSSNVVVLVLNIDQFKEVNATLGYAVGDRLLCDIAGRLRAQLREVDTVARLGADEFGVVLVGIEDREAANAVVFALRDAIARPFVVGDMNLAVEASVGGAFSPDDGVDSESLIAAADNAMGQAKRLRFGHQWSAGQRTGQIAGRMRLLADLRVAIDAGDLELHYQPKAAMLTGDITGVEALVRWRRDGAELVPPNDFIPVAEETDLMASMTRYVLENAIMQIRHWNDTGTPLCVAVNISARDLHDNELPNDIARLLNRYGVSPKLLEIEITESSIMADIDRAVATLTRLHDMGIRLAIDDFGTGNTSLAQLPTLPVDVLKIDRSFVERLEFGGDDLIVRTTIELGRGLGLDVVAEGVASAVVWDRLAEMGCDYAQGYFLSRPVMAKDVQLLIRAPSVAPGVTGNGR